MSALAAAVEAPRVEPQRDAAPLIEVRDVSVRFGGIVALDRVSFTIAERELLGLIGPNGAGKTALFRTMSVLDNVRVGSHPLGKTDFFSNALKLPWTAREERSLSDIAWELIDFLDLADVAFRRVADLPFGLQKRVELARALAARP